MDLQNRGVLKLIDMKFFILDETDQMLKQGFQEDIEKILAGGKAEFEQCGKLFSTV